MGELRHARAVFRRGRRDAHLQLERGQELLQAGGLPLQAVALGLLGVERRAVAVLAGDAEPVEGPHVLEKRRDVGGVGGQRQRQHLGAGGLHLGALLRVVVHQDEAVEPQVEIVGQGRRDWPALDSQLMRRATK